jgi:hypothetical protein
MSKPSAHRPIQAAALAAAAVAAALASLLPEPPAAWGHARIAPSPVPPRNPDPGIKTGPCGPYAPGTGVRTTLTAGQQLTFNWTETIDHPGYYRIAFSPDGVNGFDQNVLAPTGTNTPDIQNAATLPHNYSRVITVPNTPCTSCSLQLIQYMTEANPPTLYFSCADIQIVAPGGTPSPVPSPTATPTPTFTVPAPTPTTTGAPGEHSDCE